MGGEHFPEVGLLFVIIYVSSEFNVYLGFRSYKKMNAIKVTKPKKYKCTDRKY